MAKTINKKDNKDKSRSKPVSAKLKTEKKSNNLHYIFLLLIIIFTAIIYTKSVNSAFITSWDDSFHVTKNPSIRSLSSASLEDMFKISYGRYLYHPLNILSFAINYHYSGLNPKPYHLTNLILHLLNIVLVFFFIKQLTKRIDMAYLVALIFALHPMQVESVAWISERKGLLCCFFFMASLICYLKYLKPEMRHDISKRYVMSDIQGISSIQYLAFCFILFICALLSKPNAIPLFGILLLIDYYYSRRLMSIRVIAEKIPFIILSLIFAVITMKVQKSIGVTDTAPLYPVYDRIFIISYSVFFYILKFILPLNLSAIYYWPKLTNGMLPVLFYVAPICLILIAYAIYKSGVHMKKLIVGSLFFLFTVSMVVQLVPYGKSITYDRYAYIPYVGLGFIFVYLFNYLKEKYIKIKQVLNGIMVIFLILLASLTYSRTEVWANNENLFQDVINKFPDEWQASANLGHTYFENGEYEKSIEYMDKSLSLKDDAETYNNRGCAKYKLKMFAASIPDYDKSLQLNPKYALAYYNRGLSIEKVSKDYHKAIDDFTQAIKYDKYPVAALNSRGLAYHEIQDYKSAMDDFNQAIKISPDNPESYYNRARVYYVTKDYKKSLEDYNTAITVNPKYITAYEGRGNAKYGLRDLDGACMDWDYAAKNGDKPAQNYLNTYCKKLTGIRK